MLKLQKLALVSLISMASSFSYAQSTSEKTYFGLEVGTSSVDNATGELTSALVSGLGGSASATQSKNVNVFKFLIGYKHSDNVDLEVGYSKSSDVNLTFAGTTRGAVAYAGSATQGISGFEFSTNLRPDVSTGWNNAFVKVGMHNFKADYSLRVTSGSASIASSDSESGTGALYGFGYDYPMGNGSSLRFAYTKYSKIAGGDVSGSLVGVGFLKKF